MIIDVPVQSLLGLFFGYLGAHIVYNSLFASNHPDDLRRKLNIATWSTPSEASIYAKATVDVSNLLQWNKMKDKTVSINAAFGAALARVMARHPNQNGAIAFNSFFPNKTTDISMLVAIENGNVGLVKIENADKLSAADITKRMRGDAQKVRTGEDQDLAKSMALVRLLPSWLLRYVLALVGVVSSGLGIGCKPLGIKQKPFGCVMISAIGALDGSSSVDEAFAPLTPFARVPFLVLISAVRKEPFVLEDGITVAARDVVTMAVTCDHRFVDGATGVKLIGKSRSIIESDWTSLA